MNIEEIKQRTRKLEQNEKIRQMVREKDYLTNVEKLIYFGLITDDRVQLIKDIYIEKSIIYDWEVNVGVLENITINPEEIEGTDHASYSEQYLFNSINHLKNPTDNIKNLIINPEYYIKNDSRICAEKQISIIYKKHTDKFYINCGSNHRLLLAKAIGMEKVLINRVTIYDVNTKLKRLLEKTIDYGFEYEIEQSKIVITGNDLILKISGSQLEDSLDKFLNYYENLKVSIWDEKFYKLKNSLYSNFRRKYEYLGDEVRHLVHFNYLKLIEHKRIHIR